MDIISLLANPNVERIAAIIVIITITKIITKTIEVQLRKLQPNKMKRLLAAAFDRYKPAIPLFISLFIAIFFIDLSNDIIKVFYNYGKEVILFAGVSSYAYKIGKTTLLNR